MISAALLICIAWRVEMPLTLSICITVFSVLEIIGSLVERFANLEK